MPLTGQPRGGGDSGTCTPSSPARCTRPPMGPGTWSCTRGRTSGARTRPTFSAGTCSRSRFMTVDPQSPGDPVAPSGSAGEVVDLPTPTRATDIALDALDLLYAFIYPLARNRSNASHLTHHPAL